MSERFMVKARATGVERIAIRSQTSFVLGQELDGPYWTVEDGDYLILSACDDRSGLTGILEDVVDPLEFELAYDRVERGDPS